MTEIGLGVIALVILIGASGLPRVLARRLAARSRRRTDRPMLLLLLLLPFAACAHPPAAPTPVEPPLTLDAWCASRGGDRAGGLCRLPAERPDRPDAGWTLSLQIGGSGFPDVLLVRAEIRPENADVDCGVSAIGGGGTAAAAGPRSWTWRTTPSRGDTLAVRCFGRLPGWSGAATAAVHH